MMRILRIVLVGCLLAGSLFLTACQTTSKAEKKETAPPPRQQATSPDVEPTRDSPVVE